MSEEVQIQNSTVRKTIGTLSPVHPKKIKETLADGIVPLVGIIQYKASNPYSVMMGKTPDIKKVLVIAKVKEYNEKNGLCTVTVNDMSSFGKDDSLGLSDISVSIDALYDLPVEVFVNINDHIGDILVDDNGEAYIEGLECNEVYVLSGKCLKTEGKHSKRSTEVLGVFMNKDDAEKMGKTLIEYGKVNNIKYNSYTVDNFVVI